MDSLQHAKKTESEQSQELKLMLSDGLRGSSSPDEQQAEYILDAFERENIAVAVCRTCRDHS
jgi:hypothetical protein